MSRLALQSAQEFLKQLRLTAGPYAKYALEARKMYVDLRFSQDAEINGLYIRAADRLAREIRSLKRKGFGNEMNLNYLVALEQSLRDEGTGISEVVMQLTEGYVRRSVAAGTSFSMQVTTMNMAKAGLSKGKIQQIYARVNTQAVEAIWARTHNGLMLSDRIWQKGTKAETIMRDIIQDAIALGEDPVETARKLERYVRRGKKTLAYDYPEMMARMGNRIPQDISYEALRLVRTETAAAYGEGTIAASAVTPSYKGMRWLLSNNSDPCPVCKKLSEAEHGLGKGVYPPGAEPPMPAHPNCMCSLAPVHEDLDDFMDRLDQWMDDPSSNPDLEDWYQNVYSNVA